MPELNCAECIELAPELALNALTGRERATALAHLDHCSCCRQAVSELANTADQLLGLISEAEPPRGFEKRVLGALSPLAARSSPWPLAAAAGGLALLLIGTGWIVGSSMPAKQRMAQGAEPGTRTVLYAPLTNQSQEVGQAYLEPDQPSWVYLSLSSNVKPDTNLRCTITEPDSGTPSLGTFALDHGQGGWNIPAPLQHDGRIVATVIDGAGRVIGSAHFTSPISPAPNVTDPTKSAASDSSRHKPSHDKHKHHGRHHSTKEHRHNHK
jgi:hypothetical protein